MKYYINTYNNHYYRHEEGEEYMEMYSKHDGLWLDSMYPSSRISDYTFTEITVGDLMLEMI